MALWLSYIIIFAAGFSLAIANIVFKTISNASVPQVFYMFYLLMVMYVALVMHNFASVVMGFIVLIPVAYWVRAHSKRGAKDWKREMEQALAKYHVILKETPDNQFTLEFIADIYAQIEEHDLAIKYYRKALAISSDSKIQDKIDQMHADKGAWEAPDSQIAQELRACNMCESITLSSSYACGSCGSGLYPDKLTWFAMQFNSVFENNSLQVITGAGILLLPYLFFYGVAAYIPVWGVWCLALRRGRVDGAY
ncbi:tetratricopeptide repeat protein [Elusimicrobiota bacterium]